MGRQKQHAKDLYACTASTFLTVIREAQQLSTRYQLQTVKVTFT